MFSKTRHATLSSKALDLRKLSSLISCGAASALLAVLPGTSASAQNLITNGTFTQTTAITGQTRASNGNGQLGYNTNVTGWTVASNTYNFVYASGTLDATGTSGASGQVSMCGPANGNNNGLTATSPAGGSIIAMDGAYETGAVSQTLTGLTANKNYDVSFYWAGAQQSGFSGATTEQIDVYFGSNTTNITQNSMQATPVLNNVSQGFTGWKQQKFTFTATSTQQVLSFLAVGTPNGQPPFSLLSGVSVTGSALPEPGAFGLALTGVATGVMLVRKRKSKLSQAGKLVSRT